MTARILLVEDAPDVQLIVADLLRGHGHDVVVSSDGGEGLRVAGEQHFDLMILDVMLPGLSGFELCAAVRERGFDGAILMLTARAQVDDRVEGLTKGADDYLIKPFDSKELLARVAALLRRVGKTPLTPVLQYQFGEVTVDFERREVVRAGALVNLAAKELQLLRQLIDHRGQVLSRERLLSRVWQDQPFIGPRTVDVHVAWLRQKLEDNPQIPRHILTVRGEGYSFEP
ncbi:MAG TPA: response regulator transcription factor [Candidatus Sulfopaludibacter sp.]|jgi:two-component system alkaline phosphatase synthesis response regulator PhoP|nr:response regulator transcription factor [Candidatus Sulfopaludibacter sp.]